MWNKKEIEEHLECSKLLIKIKDSVIEFIKNNPDSSEKQACNFILKEFKRLGLKRDKDPPIVAFRKSTDRPHYNAYKNPKNLRKNSLILIDIWARLKGKRTPFSDITWMAYYGNKIPGNMQKIFKIVINARDKCIYFLRRELKKGRIPSGKEVDAVARNYIKKKGYGKDFKHSTGHSLGFYSAHGRKGKIRPRNIHSLLKNLGSTIEPGIYLKNKFGVRSEIDFYIDKDLKLILTTPLQKKIIKI